MKQQKISRKFRHVPGIARELPIIGNLLALRKLDTNDFKNLLDIVCPGPISKVTGFGHVMFTISDASITQKILLSPKFHQRDATIRFLEMENALFTSKYENWKPIRKPLNVVFNKKVILTMVPVINKHVDEFCERIGNFIGHGEFDIYNALAHFEIDEIFETMLHTTYKCDQNLVDTLQSTTDNIGKRVFNPIYHPEFIYRASNIHKEIQKAHVTGTKILKPIITQSIDEILDTNNNNNVSEKTNFSLIGQLINIRKDGRKLTYDEIEENVKTILTAGFETQSHAIGYILLMLAMHPDIDRKVYQEIRDNYKEGEYLTAEKVREMEYLDMVVNETLRLFPVAPLNLRVSMEDTFVEGVGMVPKGTTMFIAMYKLHRNPELWGKNADKFNPENFQREEMKKRPPFCFTPFGGGARNCIGMLILLHF